MKDKAQLSLLVFGNMDVATQSTSAFQLVEKKDENGNLLAQTFSPRKNKDIAAALNLDIKADADKLQEAIMADSDAQLDRMILLLQEAKADKSGYWTGGRSKLIFGKRGKTGKVSRAKAILELVESRRPQGPSDAAVIDKLVKAYRLPGESIEDATARVELLWEKQVADLAEAAKKAQALELDNNKSNAKETAEVGAVGM